METARKSPRRSSYLLPPLPPLPVRRLPLAAKKKKEEARSARCRRQDQHNNTVLDTDYHRAFVAGFSQSLGTLEMHAWSIVVSSVRLSVADSVAGTRVHGRHTRTVHFCVRGKVEPWPGGEVTPY